MSINKLKNIQRLTRDEAIQEFAGYIAGINTEDNQFSIFNPSISNFLNSFRGSSDKINLRPEDARMLNNALLGTDGAAYFLKDITSGKAFNMNLTDSEAANKFKESFTVFYEGKSLFDFVSKEKVSATIAMAKVGDAREIDIDESEGVDLVLNLSELAVNESGTPSLRNLNINKKVNNPDKFESPTLGAVVCSDGVFSLPTRGGDELALFFNMIPTIEMSKCAPFLSVKFVTDKNENEIDNMSTSSFLRFVGDKLVLDDDPIGFRSASRAVGKSIARKLSNDVLSKEEPHIAGMELMLSPQTMTNADARQQDSRILDPIVPLLTLNGFTVSISGLGVGLFSSKRGRLKLTLHDRSRLPDISPLVSIEEFGQTKVIVEYGWSHPEGGPGSTNTVGKFLNNLRDGGVFTLVSSNLSFNGSKVDIDLDIAMSGEMDSKICSVANGVMVQSNIFKPQVESIIKKETDKITDRFKPSEHHNKEIRTVKRVALNEAAGRNSLIDRQKFVNIMTAGAKAVSSSEVLELIAKELDIANLVSSTHIDQQISDPDDEVDEFKDSEKSLVKELSSKIVALEFTDDAFIQPATKDKLITDLIESGQTGPAEQTQEFEDIASEPGKGETFVSLGKILMSLVGTSLASIGRYDEVQMFFYPMNYRSAGAHIYTTADFPILFSRFEEIINNAIEDNATMTVTRLFSLIERKIMRDPGYIMYGLKDEIEKIKTIKALTLAHVKGTVKDEEMTEGIKELIAEYSLEDSFAQPEDATEEVLAQELEAFKQFKKSIINEYNDNKIKRLENIYKNGKFKNAPPADKFVMPNLSLYFETLNPYVKDGDSFAVDETKVILKVHVYDEESTPNEAEHMMQDILMGDVTSLNALNSEQSLSVKNMSPAEAKAYIKGKMPSINYGSAFSPVSSFTVSGQTGGNIGDALLITSMLDKRDPQNQGTGPISDLSDIKVVPTTAAMSCLGMPIMQRGNQFYVDLKSNTTADNVYAVKSVTHDVGPGRFTTKADLMYVAQNSFESLRNKIVRMLDKRNNHLILPKGDVKK